MPKLGVNIDHIATLRQARKEFDPDPVSAVAICESSGADSIVAHLREDRRHIQDRDILRLKKCVRTKFNFEMSLNKEILRFARKVHPDEATIVPERRKEVTTEGGLDVARHFKRIKDTVKELQRESIAVSLFVDPIKDQILRSLESGAKIIELHTGRYDHARTPNSIKKELNNLKDMAAFAQSLGLTVNAGHGLKYTNTRPVALIAGIEELNIGHAIISRAVFVGLAQAVREMKKLTTI